MSSNDMPPEVTMNLEIQRSTVSAISAYCRVLELHLKAVAEGANPRISGGSPMVKIAETELVKELGFLRSLRNGMIGEDDERDSPES